MEGSNTAQNPQQATAPPQQSLIRFEQVRKLPHLTDQQKTQQEVIIQKLWDTINSTPPDSLDHQRAYTKLGQQSATLMAGMRAYQNLRKQQQAQQAQLAAQAGQQNTAGGAAQGGGSSVQFKDLNPIIQQRVNTINFTLPPAMVIGTPDAEKWLREAKARYGQALQRSEVAKNKRAELQRTVQARQQAGNPLTQQETDIMNAKLAQCNRAINESEVFMGKFKEQQQQFQRTQQQNQQRFTTHGQPGLSDGGEQAMMANMQANAASQQGPTAHSISSAVSAAARNQATAAQAAMSPQNAQAQSAQGQNASSSTPVSQHPSNTNPSPFTSQQSQADVPTSATSQHQGPPRSLSHQAAMSQSAQSHAALQQHQQASAAHAHPAGYLNPTKKDDRHPIPKTLQVTAPVPVKVPSARPTLNGGPGVGMPGQMSQPAIPSMPGYVLETSEDGRVLSKKKLNELVREVCGLGGDEQLTPDVEEIVLQIADDFVDDLITDACRLAKLRGSTTLEIRDLQLVLERKYNIRVPGFSSDEIRTVRRPQPAAGWAQKMGAVTAAKLTGGGNTSAGAGPVNGVKET